MKWIWPVLIILSTMSVNFVTAVQVPVQLRALVAAWFLLVCPGMAIIGMLALKDRVTELTLSIALSLALDAIVALMMVYSEAWSPENGLRILTLISYVGAATQILTAYTQSFLNWLVVTFSRTIDAGRRLFSHPFTFGSSARQLFEMPVLSVFLFAFGFFTIAGGLAIIAILVFVSIYR